MKRTFCFSVVCFLVSLTVTDAQQSDRLWRGVFLFDRDSVNLSQMRDSLGLNTFQYRTGTGLSDVWDNVALTDTNLKLINQRDIPRYISSGQRMIYEAEQAPSSVRNYFDSKHPNVQPADSGVFLESPAPAGYMVKSATPNDQYGNGQTSYFATFRLKVEGTPAETTALVARCLVFCLTHQDTLEDSLLQFNDFGTTDYKEFILPFSLVPLAQCTPPCGDTAKYLSGGEIQRVAVSTCSKVDLQVYWYGTVTTYLDNVVVEDSLGHRLFAREFDNYVKQDAGLAASFSAHDLFYLQDEPIISQFLSFNYVGNLIKDTVGEFNPRSGRVTAQYQNFTRFLADAQPTRLMVDPYFIDSDIPHPSPTISDDDAREAGFAPWNYTEYTSTLQSHIDIALANFFRPAAVLASTTNGYDTLIFIPQLHGIFYKDTGKYRRPIDDAALRPPAPSELQLQFSLGMAYGAKGFVGYPFGTDEIWYEATPGAFYVVKLPGLVSATKHNNYYENHWSNFESMFDHDRWTGYKEKWDALTLINARLKNIGDTLLALKWIGAKSWTDVPEDTLWSFIVDSVQTKDTLGNADETPYVEVGHLRRGTVPDYIVVVNRRCATRSDAYDTRDISMTLGVQQGNWLVTDTEANRSWVVKQGQAFTDRFQPGEGKIYRLEDANVNGTRTFSQLRFVGGATLTLAAGANVTAGGNMDTVKISLGNSATFTADTGSTFVVSTDSAFPSTSTCSLKLYGTLTIADSVALKFMEGTSVLLGPGAQILLGPGAGLESDGTLSAQGTAAYPVRFKSSSLTPAPGDWQMITLKGGPNTLRHCVVEYSHGGVYFNNTSTNLLDSCTVKHSNGYGVQAFNTSLTANSVRLHDCTIDSNNAGLWVGSGRVDIVQSSGTYGIRQNGYGCVLQTGGKLYLNGAYVTSNDDWGIYVNGTTAQAVLSPNGIARGYNRVRDNADGQIWVLTGSAFLGNTNTICRCDPPPGYGDVIRLDEKKSGGGGIETNCPPPCYVDPVEYGCYNYVSGNHKWIKNETAAGVYARLTYWGQPQVCPPPDSAFYGPVDRTQCKTGGGENYFVGKGDGGFEPRSENLLDSTLISALLESLKDDLLSGSVGARPALHQLASLCGVGGTFRHLLRMDWRNLLDLVLTRNVPVEVKHLVRAYRLQDMMDKKVFDQAIAYANSISSIQDDELWFHAQATIIYALVATGQTEQANAQYQAIKGRATGINPTATAHLEYFLGMQTSSLGSAGEGLAMAVGADAATEHPSKTSLDGNYPNPFNPSTTIRYTLAEPSFVSLRVYDLLGREVMRLVDEVQNSGSHSAVFDASGMASGVYFYKFQAGAFTAVKRMVVVK